MAALFSRRVQAALAVVLGVGLGALPVLYFGRSHAVAPDRRAQQTDYFPPPHLDDDHAYRIVAFGSSSTRGFGASSAAMTYPAQLERLFKARNGTVEVVNRGVNGEDIRDMTRRLFSDILSRRPSLVIWQMGSNDPLRHVPLDLFEANLHAGIAAIRATGAEVMLMEPQWCPEIETIDPANRFLESVRRIGRKENVYVIPRFQLMQQWMETGFVAEKDLIGPDHLHMTDRGYELLARAVFDVIVSLSRSYAVAIATQHDGVAHTAQGTTH